MHELGLSREIVDIVARRAEGRAVVRVRLEVGRLAAVVPDALRFCFEACAIEAGLGSPKLEIDEVPGRARCGACGAELTLDLPYGVCACG